MSRDVTAAAPPMPRARRHDAGHGPAGRHRRRRHLGGVGAPVDAALGRRPARARGAGAVGVRPAKPPRWPRSSIWSSGSSFYPLGYLFIARPIARVVVPWAPWWLVALGYGVGPVDLRAVRHGPPDRRPAGVPGLHPAHLGLAGRATCCSPWCWPGWCAGAARHAPSAMIWSRWQRRASPPRSAMQPPCHRIIAVLCTFSSHAAIGPVMEWWWDRSRCWVTSGSTMWR